MAEPDPLDVPVSQRTRRLAVFVTRDGYISAVLLDALPERITMTTKSRDLARDGHPLDFTRVGSASCVPAIYEEDVPEGI